MTSESPERYRSGGRAGRTLAELIEALDPEVRDAIDDVDRTLIALSLEQSPWNRLRSASRMAQALARMSDVAASQGH